MFPTKGGKQAPETPGCGAGDGVKNRGGWVNTEHGWDWKGKVQETRSQAECVCDGNPMKVQKEPVESPWCGLLEGVHEAVQVVLVVVLLLIPQVSQAVQHRLHGGLG